MPSSPDMKDDALLKSKASVQLDARGTIMNQAKLQADATKMAQWLDARERAGNTDGLYADMKNRYATLMKGGVVDPAIRNVNALHAQLAIGPIPERMAAIGTPLARSIGQQVNKFSEVEQYVRRNVGMVRQPR